MALAIGLGALAPRASLATDYHVSPSGDDAWPGTLAQPWRTIDRVNAASLAAGDRVLFEGGAVHAGSLELWADDVGTAADPIVVASYGTGRAVLDAGAERGVSVYNTAGIEIRDLDVRGGWDASTQSGSSESGVEIYMDLPGATRLEHVVVERCDVSGFRQAGIVVGAWPTDGTWGGFRDVRIERCDSHDNGDAGISSWGWWDPAGADWSHRDLVVRRCRAFRNRGLVGHSNNTGNGIVVSGVDGALIELSEAFENGDLCDHDGGGPVGIWAWDASRVVIQSCESHHNRTGSVSADGGGFDLDGGVVDSVMQYNWSHDNDGAGYLVYQFWGAREPLGRNVVRYNVSQDDGRQHGYGGIYVGGGAAVTDNVFHGNTIFLSPSGNPGIAGIILDGVGTGNAFVDNVVVTTGGARLVSSDSAYARTSAAFHGNCWWAGRPSDFQVRWGGASHASLDEWRAAGQETFGVTTTGMSVDPLLENAGGAGTIGDPDALAGLVGYRPLPGSPLVDAGLDIATLFGVDPGSRDYAGGALPQGRALDVGAFEGAGCTPPAGVGDSLRVARPAGILFTWQDVAGATSYAVREARSLPDAFDSLTGSAASGVTGLAIPIPAANLIFYVVAAENACGEGPRQAP